MKKEALSKEINAGCLVCRKDIEYFLRETVKACVYCHIEISTNAYCSEGHFVCDDCHKLQSNDLIETFCKTTKLKDPLKIANHLMRNPTINMHGPEHHFLVPAALIAAYCNTDLSCGKSRLGFIETARKRAESIPSGSCGFMGSCGAGIGSGIFMSIITRSTPLSIHGWRYANLATAGALKEIAEHGGPRCCKRDTYLSIKNTARFLHESFNQRLYDYSADIVCDFAHLNKECLEEECPFFAVDDNKLYKEYPAAPLE